MRFFGWKGPSGFSVRSTAEEVTQGIDGTGLTAIVTGLLFHLGVASFGIVPTLAVGCVFFSEGTCGLR